MTHNALGHEGAGGGRQAKGEAGGDTDDVIRMKRRGIKTCSNDRFAASGLDGSG